MKRAVFFRLLNEPDKAAALSAAICGPRDTSVGRYEVDQSVFSRLPGTPFAYWADSRMRRVFLKLAPFEGQERTAKQGLTTADDFRFGRAWWEVPPTRTPSRWVPLAKGGSFSPFYADLPLVVNWSGGGEELYAFNHIPYGTAGAPMRNPSYYFMPGLTWPHRGSVFSTAALPEGCIFSSSGKAAFVPSVIREAMLGLFNSATVNLLLRVQSDAVRIKFECGLVSRTPICATSDVESLKPIALLAKSAWALRRAADSTNEISHAFTSPWPARPGAASLAQLSSIIDQRDQAATAALAAITQDLDARCFHLYGLDEADYRAVLPSAARADGDASDEVEARAKPEVSESVENASTTPRTIALSQLSYAVGSAYGRFDVRCATGELDAPEPTDPFAPLPACSPGMLIGSDGMPLSVEPPGYPLRVSWDGILVDDPGFVGSRAHADDVVSRVREVLALVWGERAEEIEHEACGLLGVRSLRDFFRRPSGFFAEHLARYSKSRRQAPIYWPLATASGSYTLWLYYPRLDEDLLYTAVNRYLEPKMSAVGRRLGELDALLSTASGRDATELRKEREELAALQVELADLRAELLRAAALPYKPDLDDGVLISAAPLARLFRLTKWRKDLEACWKKLEHGDFDWAHLANAVWPDRVLEACRRDRSIAIAHGVEEAFEG